MNVDVKYQIATYRGTVSVNAEENDDDETIIAKAKANLKSRCGGVSIYPGGPCYESWKVVAR